MRGLWKATSGAIVVEAPTKRELQEKLAHEPAVAPRAPGDEHVWSVVAPGERTLQCRTFFAGGRPQAAWTVVVPDAKPRRVRLRTTLEARVRDACLRIVAEERARYVKLKKGARNAQLADEATEAIRALDLVADKIRAGITAAPRPKKLGALRVTCPACGGASPSAAQPCVTCGREGSITRRELYAWRRARTRSET